MRRAIRSQRDRADHVSRRAGGAERGRTNVLQRNYNQALTELKKLDGQKIERDFVRQDIDYYRALCQCRLAMSEGGDKTAATTAMLNFVKSAAELPLL